MKFTIYKYELIKTNERKIFQETEVGTERAQDYLGSLFEAPQLNLFATSKKTGEPTAYPNSILKIRQGVVLMRVCNVKHVTLVQAYKERREESNPFCHVIIDNRPGIGQIAIEHTKAFDNRTDKVSAILQESLHALLADVGLNIEIHAKMRTRDFWETVEEQVYRKGDRVRRVVFDFADPDQATPIDAPPSAIEALRFLHAVSADMGAARSQYKLDATREGTLRLDRTREDLAQMVTLCCNNGYQISVHFHHMGVYRYGKQSRAVYELDEEVLEGFVGGQQTLTDTPQQEPGFALLDWLDNVREQTKTYNHETQTEGKRKRKHRRAL